jgi:hypothetical protein
MYIYIYIEETHDENGTARTSYEDDVIRWESYRDRGIHISYPVDTSVKQCNDISKEENVDNKDKNLKESNSSYYNQIKKRIATDSNTSSSPIDTTSSYGDDSEYPHLQVPTGVTQNSLPLYVPSSSKLHNEGNGNENDYSGRDYDRSTLTSYQGDGIENYENYSDKNPVYEGRNDHTTSPIDHRVPKTANPIIGVKSTSDLHERSPPISSGTASSDFPPSLLSHQALAVESSLYHHDINIPENKVENSVPTSREQEDHQKQKQQRLYHQQQQYEQQKQQHQQEQYEIQQQKEQQRQQYQQQQYEIQQQQVQLEYENEQQKRYEKRQLKIAKELEKERYKQQKLIERQQRQQYQEEQELKQRQADQQQKQKQFQQQQHYIESRLLNNTPPFNDSTSPYAHLTARTKSAAKNWTSPNTPSPQRSTSQPRSREREPRSSSASRRRGTPLGSRSNPSTPNSLRKDYDLTLTYSNSKAYNQATSPINKLSPTHHASPGKVKLSPNISSDRKSPIEKLMNEQHILAQQYYKRAIDQVNDISSLEISL